MRLHRNSHSTTSRALAISATCLIGLGGLAACSGAEKTAPETAAKSATSAATATAAKASDSRAVSSKSTMSSADETDTGARGPEYTKSDGGVDITVHDLLKPNNEILVSAHCKPEDTRATLTTSLSDTPIEMTPAADSGELLGDIKAPNEIGPGPKDGYHTITVECASGAKGTITMDSAGNGDNAPADNAPATGESTEK